MNALAKIDGVMPWVSASAQADLAAVRAEMAELIAAAEAMQATHGEMLARWWQQHSYADKVLGGTACTNTGRMGEILARINGTQDEPQEKAA